MSRSSQARGASTPAEFHDELVLMYLQAVQEERLAGKGWSEHTHSAVRRRLLDYLQVQRSAPQQNALF
eukprot:6442578-Pyramimonas_sp.AAC.1